MSFLSHLTVGSRLGAVGRCVGSEVGLVGLIVGPVVGTVGLIMEEEEPRDIYEAHCSD